MPNKEELEFLKKQIQDVEQKLSELTSKASQIPEMVSTSQSNAQKKSELYLLEMQVASHTQYLNTLKQQYAPLEVMIRELSNSNALLQANSNSLQNSINGHQTQISELQNIFASLVQISNTYAESNGVKLDPTMVYIDTAPANYLVHTNAFTDAIKNNHKEAFDLALSKISNDDINFRDSKGKTILMYSAANAFFYAVESLLNHGAKAEMYDKEGYDALYYAVKAPHIRCTELIAEKISHSYINHIYINSNGNTILHTVLDAKEMTVFGDEKSLFIPTGNDTYGIDTHGGNVKLVVTQNLTLSFCSDLKRPDGYNIAEHKRFSIIELLINKAKADINIKNDAGDTVFSLACAYKLHYLANKLIDSFQIDLNISDDSSFRCMLYGLERGDIGFFKKLHEHGLNLNIKNSNEETLLSAAVQFNNSELVSYLLKHGAQHDVPSLTGVYPWHTAAYVGALDALQVLRTQVNNVDLRISGQNSSTALWCAAQQGHVNVVEWLIGQGADINFQDSQKGETSLFAAARTNKKVVVEALIKYKADPTICNYQGITPLHIAAYLGNNDIVCVILKCTAVDIPSSMGHMTPLWLAAQEGKLEAVRLLTEAGANINPLSGNGLYAIHIATIGGHVEMIKYLASKGVDINIETSKGQTLLSIAAQHNFADLILELIKCGAKHDIPTKLGFFPYHLAAYYGSLNALKALSQHVFKENPYVDLQTKCAEKMTPLWLVAQQGHVGVAQWLIDEGADINYARASDGCTVLQKAISSSRVEFVKMLIDRNANINKADTEGASPLYYALGFGGQPIDLEIVELLLQKGANVVQAMNDGDTPMHMAHYSGNVGAIKLLLKYNADLNVQNNEGKTPLHCLLGKKSLAYEVKSKIVHEFAAKYDSKILDTHGQTAIDMVTIDWPEAIEWLQHPENLAEVETDIHVMGALSIV